MRRTEELAKWHEAMAAEPKRNEGKRKRHAESAAELRRLSTVEAELIALKKAIGDAEPVAWMMNWPNHPPSFTTEKSDYVSWLAGKAAYPDELITLYTLKGIK